MTSKAKRSFLSILSIFTTLFFPLSARAETKLIIATGELPPSVSKNTEESFLTEIFDAIGKEMNVTFVFQFMPWKRCESSVEEMIAWGAIPYVRTPERENKFFFSERLYKSTSYLFGYSKEKERTNITFNKLDDLNMYRFGGVRGYWYENLFSEAKIPLELVSSEQQNIRKLESDRIDLTPMDETVGWYIINKIFPQQKDNFYTLETPVHSHDAFLITSKNYPNGENILLDFNKALRTIKENGKFGKISKKHGVLYEP